MKKRKKLKLKKMPLIASICVLVILALFIFPNSFSETIDDSAWDGIVANSFTSGTGTEENPYIISSPGEYAYFKKLMESEDAIIYSDKTYIIATSINYGKNDLSINNSIPFSGTIDGQGNTIYNAKINNNLFTSIDNATIKNISMKEIEYTLTNETGAILTNEINKSTIEMLIIEGNVSVTEKNIFGGLVYTSSNTKYENIVLDYNITKENEEAFKFANKLTDDEGNNILIKKDEIKITNSETDIIFDQFEIKENKIEITNEESIDKYKTEDYKITIKNNSFALESIPKENINDEDIKEQDKNESKSEIIPKKSPLKSPARSVTITEHNSGLDGTTLYINDLKADLNYFNGLNHAEIRNTSIPSGTSTGYYNPEYLVKVQIIYDGKDINNSNLVGAVSPINSENTNKFVYFKYYPLERTSTGALATNQAGDNYIKIELIDNPFSKRPYVGGTEYGFNGWVCNQNEDSSQDLCDNSVFSFEQDTYTRYMEVSATGGSEIIIHLNANWYKADVVTSYNSISNFDTMSMQQVSTHPVEEIVHHYAKIYWRQNYTTMELYDTYNRYSTMPTGYWYKTNQTSTTYTRVRNRQYTQA